MKPRVSVVIPVRGPSLSLEICIESLCRQWPPFVPGEVVIVDDGSGADFSHEITDPGVPLRLLRVPVRSGPATARNFGVDSARADWIAFLDDDCIVPWGWTAAVMAHIKQHPQPHLAGGLVKGTVPGNWFCDATEDFVLTPTVVEGLVHVATASAVAHREALAAVGGFDAGFRIAGGEDWDLCRRLHMAGIPVTLDASLYCYHRNPTGPRGFYERARRYGAAAYQLDQRPVSWRGRTEPGLAASVVAVGALRRASLRLYRGMTKPAFFRRRYRELRAQGVPRARSIRSTLLYASFVAVYDMAYAVEGRRRSPEASPLIA